MKHLYIFLLIALLSGSCNSQNASIIDLKHTHSISIPKQNQNQDISILKPKLFIINNEPIISYIDVSNRIIRFYNIQKSIHIDSVDININKHQFVQDYYIISPDSVMLAFNTTYFLMEHDNCIQIFDRKKNKIGSINFENSNVLLKQNQKKTINRSNFFYSDYTYFPLIFKNGLTVTSTVAYNQKYCDTLFQNNKIKPIGISGLTESEIKSKEIEINFHCPEYGGYYPINFKYPRGAYGDGIMYIGFANEPRIYAVDVSDLSIKSKIIDFITIKKIELRNTVLTEFFDYTQPEFIDMVYNHFDNHIYWFARMETDSLDIPIYQNYPQISFSKIDKDLNKKGEGLLPIGCQPPILPYKNGFFAYNKKESIETNSIIYSFFELFEESSNRKNLINDFYQVKIRKKLSQDEYNLEYLKIITKKEDGLFLLIPLDNSCKSCIDKIHLFFCEKVNKYNLNKQLNIIIISTNENRVKNFIDNTWLIEIDNILFYDKTEKYTSYMKTWTNPRLMILKENKIQKDKSYSPSEINDIIRTISNINPKTK